MPGRGEDRRIDRRMLLAFGAVAGTAAAADAIARHDGTLGGPSQTITNTLPWREGAADAPDAAPPGALKYLTAAEAAFLTAAVDRMIPPDPTGPGGSEAGVVTFIDRQLAGGYGQGDHFYLEGPWPEGTASQGYQSRFTPAQFYRHALAAIETAVGRANGGKAFKDLDAATQDAMLKQMEADTLALDGPITSKAFFAMFLQNVLEGYFSDPLYGGNRGGKAWEMIGFPGAHYDYSPWVKAHGLPVPVATVGLRGRAAWSRG
jgi:gluconate 2-dehydrogenase gamma chain